jgi:outer membrane protein assembly factor BamB
LPDNRSRSHGRPSRAAYPSVLALLTACFLFGDAPTGPAGTVRERWSQPEPGFAFAVPVIVGDAVVFGTGSGEFVARKQATGEELWRTRLTSERIDGSRLLERDGVVVAAARRSVHAVDASTGARLWSWVSPIDTVDSEDPRPGHVDGSRLDADQSTVYVPAWGASVSALDLRSGALKWIWRPEGSVHRTGAGGVRLSGDTLLVSVWHFLVPNGTRSEAWLVALDRLTGTELWRLVLPDESNGTLVWAAPSVWRDFAFLNTIDGRRYKVNRFTRAIAWQTGLLPSPIGVLSVGSDAVVVGDIIYHDAGSQRLWARRATDGVVLWSTPFSGQFEGELTVTARRIYGSTYGYLNVFDRATGRLVAEIQQPRTGDPVIASAPAFKGKQLFVNVNGAAWSFDEP